MIPDSLEEARAVAMAAIRAAEDVICAPSPTPEQCHYAESAKERLLEMIDDLWEEMEG